MFAVVNRRRARFDLGYQSSSFLRPLGRWQTPGDARNPCTGAAERPSSGLLLPFFVGQLIPSVSLGACRASGLSFDGLVGAFHAQAAFLADVVACGSLSLPAHSNCSGTQP